MEDFMKIIVDETPYTIIKDSITIRPYSEYKILFDGFYKDGYETSRIGISLTQDAIDFIARYRTQEKS